MTRAYSFRRRILYTRDTMADDFHQIHCGPQGDLQPERKDQPAQTATTVVHIDDKYFNFQGIS